MSMLFSILISISSDVRFSKTKLCFSTQKSYLEKPTLCLAFLRFSCTPGLPGFADTEGVGVTQYVCPLTRHDNVPGTGKPDPAKEVVEKEGKRCEPGSRQEAIVVQVASRNGTTLAFLAMAVSRLNRGTLRHPLPGSAERRFKTLMFHVHLSFVTHPERTGRNREDALTPSFLSLRSNFRHSGQTVSCRSRS